MKAVTLGFIIWLLFLTVALCSCTSISRELKNPDTGQVYYCRNTGFGFIGVPIAMYNQSKCEENAARNGYTQ